jgi:hypothetical protein
VGAHVNRPLFGLVAMKITKMDAFIIVPWGFSVEKNIKKTPELEDLCANSG